jgi:hypothetical protein
LGQRVRNRLLRFIPTDSQSIALFIVVIAILAAFGSWRASVWAGRAADFDQRAAQELIVKGQFDLTYRGSVAHKRRLHQRYEGHAEAAQKLERDARRLRSTDPRESHSLYRQAQRARVVADTARLELVAPASYSPTEELRQLKEQNPTLQDLRPEELRDLGAVAQQRKSRLVAIYICLVMAIVVLTFALLNEGRVRQALAATGAVVSMVGITAFALQAMLA